MQRYQYQQLRVTDLLLNTQNPRFNPVQHQAQAIHAMLEDQGDKLIELARHIAENGLSPTEIVLVQPLGGQWLVREGNRRVTALKLVNEPNLIPDTHAKIKREFTTLSKSIDSDILDNIQCAIVADEKLINEWIRLKHTGENKGAGTVGWDAQQTSRFSAQVSGKADPRSTFFESLKENFAIPQALREKFSGIKKTNFDRLVGDPKVRTLMEIETKNGEFDLPGGANAHLLTMLSDLAGDFSVGRIYTKTDRESYLTDLKKRVTNSKESYPSTTSDNGRIPEFNSVESLTDPTVHADPMPAGIIPEHTTEKRKGYPLNRKMLVPSLHKLVIGIPRIARIFSELKTIDCEQFPNAASVLFRVFVELSCDFYISSVPLTGLTVDSKLTAKIEAVADNIETKSSMTRHELRAARQMATSQTQNQSVKTFHSYVHNKDVTPIPGDLKVAWDDLWPFIQTMWR